MTQMNTAKQGLFQRGNFRIVAWFFASFLIVTFSFCVVCAAETVAGTRTVGKPATVPKKTSLCDMITCSDHGKCIELNDSPTCVCDEGYLPDRTNGLHCIPIATYDINANSHSAPPKTEEEIKKELDDMLDDEAFEDRYSSYWHASNAKGYNGTLPGYLTDTYTSKRNLGISLFTIGLVLLAPVPAFICVSPFEEELFAPLAVGLGTVGTVFTAIGAVSMTRNGRRVKKLERYFAKERHRKIRFEGASLISASSHLKGGATARFSF